MSSLIQVPNLNMVAAGSGDRVLGHESDLILDETLALSGAEKSVVLIIGSAEPTRAEYKKFVVTARERFQALGTNVNVVNLHKFHKPPSEEEALDKIGSATTIWVAGGDTLQMMDFWREHGIVTMLREAAAKGTVMSGGSAGMLAWWREGLSDYKSYRVDEGEPWDYAIVAGLGFLAATGCPHYDSKTGDAEMREVNFKDKLRRDRKLPSPGIGITDLAALAISNGSSYRVIVEERNAGVHILTKKIDEADLHDEQLPISDEYEPLNF